MQVSFFHLLLEFPLKIFLFFVGPSACGKTSLATEIFKRRVEIFNPPPLRIVVWYLFYQELYKQLSSEISDIYFVSTFEEAKTLLIPQSLLFIDDNGTDLSQNTALRRSVTDIFTKESHHLGYSIILVLHNLYEPKIRTFAP